MNFVLEPRHWALIGLAALFGLAGYFVLPSHLSIFSLTTLAFPLLAGAAVLDTLGSVADALWPLMGVLSDLKITYDAWRDAGWPLPRAPTPRDMGDHQTVRPISTITAGRDDDHRWDWNPLN